MHNDDECRTAEHRCDGKVALTCEHKQSSSCSEGCFGGGMNVWRKEDCRTNVCVDVPSGALCALSAKPDPRCSRVASYCDGTAHVSCDEGFAVQRIEDLWLRAPREAQRYDASRVAVVQVRHSVTLEVLRGGVNCGSRDVTSASLLTSDTPSVATVDVDGSVLGVSVGTAIISATSGDDTATMTIYVGWNFTGGVAPGAPEYTGTNGGASINVE